VEIVKALLDAGCDVDQSGLVTHKGKRDYVYVDNGSPAIVNCINENYHDSRLNITGFEYTRDLEVPDYLAVLNLLIAYGVDVNIYTNDEAMSYPCFFMDNLEFLEIILKHGADVNKENASGQTPLYLA